MCKGLSAHNAIGIHMLRSNFIHAHAVEGGVGQHIHLQGQQSGLYLYIPQLTFEPILWHLCVSPPSFSASLLKGRSHLRGLAEQVVWKLERHALSLLAENEVKGGLEIPPGRPLCLALGHGSKAKVVVECECTESFAAEQLAAPVSLRGWLAVVREAN